VLAGSASTGALQVGVGNRQPVDIVLAVCGHGDDSLALRFGLVDAVGRSRQPDGRALLQQWCNDHHDDQEHEHDVDERRHVDVRLNAPFGAADIHCHG
jgi:hypothetical protein